MGLRGNQGMSLLEVMIAMLGMGVLSLSMMTMYQNSANQQAQLSSLQDKQTLRLLLTQIVGNRDSCNALFSARPSARPPTQTTAPASSGSTAGTIPVNQAQPFPSASADSTTTTENPGPADVAGPGLPSSGTAFPGTQATAEPLPAGHASVEMVDLPVALNVPGVINLSVGQVSGGLQINGVQLQNLHPIAAGSSVHQGILSVNVAPIHGRGAVGTVGGPVEVPVMVNINEQGQVTGCQPPGTTPDRIVVLNSNDTTQWQCANQIDIREQCSGEFGCTVRFYMFNKLNAQDQVKNITEYWYFEQPNFSRNRHPSIRMHVAWPVDTDVNMGNPAWRYSITSPWSWVYALNYSHAYCHGQNNRHSPAYTNPYAVSFISHPNVAMKVLIQKNEAHI
ncbi:MAG: hypothetical protein AB7P04_04785 [Bacteriovoracia bacterium]